MLRRSCLIDDPKFFELFGASSREPALELSGGRYPASVARYDNGLLAKFFLSISTFQQPDFRGWSMSIHQPQPDFSARVANAWSRKFHQTNLERKVQATSTTAAVCCSSN